ncbi:MAG: glucose-6-phosphate isomerase, partial [Candidatus Sumerlaeia bacterium]|nr:glucose-6-phosphate isomerase [Candidatus Sumerlaeia bacterium]
MTASSLWSVFQSRYCAHPELGFSLDYSRMNIPADFLSRMEPRIQGAYDAMAKLEAGAIANPDENRMVGHYWLRNTAIAPAEQAREIEEALNATLAFTDAIHTGQIKSSTGEVFQNLLVVGIGGSALGPQLAQMALSTPHDAMAVYFLDNTDPDGMDVVYSQLQGQLGSTLVLVISKSGGTKETRNGMLETKAFFQQSGVNFFQHAVAVTGAGSQLDQLAVAEGWLKRLPMFDYIGGRTSELAVVGLLPAALQGIDIQEFLYGASVMDQWTRSRETKNNPAALMALMWFHATKGKGEKDLVILPYKDRLVLLSKYLQQLIMESLGKELDLEGKVVHQGISVYGNKGATDQHAYIQQLREGVPNFFATFIEVLKHREGDSMEVEPGITSGDYLNGFRIGTRGALYEKSRESMTITLQDLTPESLGAVIALFERAVGFYATLVNINAYHQPGVEAGKKAAGVVLYLQLKLMAALKGHPGVAKNAEGWAAAIGAPEKAEEAYHILCHLAVNRSNVTWENPWNPGKT